MLQTLTNRGLRQNPKVKKFGEQNVIYFQPFVLFIRKWRNAAKVFFRRVMRHIGTMLRKRQKRRRTTKTTCKLMLSSYSHSILPGCMWGKYFYYYLPFKRFFFDELDQLSLGGCHFCTRGHFCTGCHFCMRCHFCTRTLLHGDSFARGVTFARDDIFARRHFYTSKFMHGVTSCTMLQ